MWKENDFSFFGVIITVLTMGIIGMLGVIGYARWELAHPAPMPMISVVSKIAKTSSTLIAPAVTSTQDLDAASAALDQSASADSTTSDTSQLNAQANF